MKVIANYKQKFSFKDGFEVILCAIIRLKSNKS